MNQYYYRNLKDNSKIIRVYENEAPDWNEWEQISDREATQSARIAELEAALKAYENEHAENAHDLGVDAGMAYPPDECDCDNCINARKLLKGNQS